jgi:hypothetical protein
VSLSAPYYQDDAVTIYHADSSETELDQWHEWDYRAQFGDGQIADMYEYSEALVGEVVGCLD